jgi:hypothetical protein
MLDVTVTAPMAPEITPLYPPLLYDQERTAPVGLSSRASFRHRIRLHNMYVYIKYGTYLLNLLFDRWLFTLGSQFHITVLPRLGNH